MKTGDWTRLLPRPKGSSDQARRAYLVEFLLHRRGSEAAKQKAIKEMDNLTRKEMDNLTRLSRLTSKNPC